MSKLPTTLSLTTDEAIYFRDQLREARAAVARDSEGYQEILYCLERLGSKLTHTVGSLGEYAGVIGSVAGRSPLARVIPQAREEWHIRFPRLYSLVQSGRNDALHQGAFARHLTVHAVELALVLEDALMNGSTKVGEFMVRSPVCAYPWQPVSFIRQTMLVNSYSYLPVLLNMDQAMGWYLITDYAVAQYLRLHQEPKTALVNNLGDAIISKEIELVKPHICAVDSPITEVFQQANGRPALILRKGTADLVGIVTPFDLL